MIEILPIIIQKIQAGMSGKQVAELLYRNGIGLKEAIEKIAFDAVTKDALTNLSVTIKQFKDPVNNISDLPKKGNEVGDGRIVKNDKDVNGNSYIHVWTGTLWSRTPYTTLPGDVATKTELKTKTDKKSFLNQSNEGTGLVVYPDRATARNAVDVSYRETGCVLVYNLNNSEWVVEQYIGFSTDIAPDWSKDINWKPLGNQPMINLTTVFKTGYINRTFARNAVSPYMRVPGIIITYNIKNSDVWITEQFKHSEVLDWGENEYWEDLGSSSRVFDGGRADTKYGGARHIDCGKANG